MGGLGYTETLSSIKSCLQYAKPDLFDSISYAVSRMGDPKFKAWTAEELVAMHLFSGCDRLSNKPVRILVTRLLSSRNKFNRITFPIEARKCIEEFTSIFKSALSKSPTRISSLFYAPNDLSDSPYANCKVGDRYTHNEFLYGATTSDGADAVKMVQIQNPLVTDLRPDGANRWHYATKAGLTLEVYAIDGSLVKCRVVNPNDPPLALSENKPNLALSENKPQPSLRPTSHNIGIHVHENQAPAVHVHEIQAPAVNPTTEIGTSAVPNVAVPQEAASKKSSGLNTITLIVIIGVSVLALVMTIVMIICCCRRNDTRISRLGPRAMPVLIDIVPSPRSRSSKRSIRRSAPRHVSRKHKKSRRASSKGSKRKSGSRSGASRTKFSRTGCSLGSLTPTGEMSLRVAGGRQ